MIVLGIGCSSFHDPSAAILVNGELIAAAEEERFNRQKHAHGCLPIEAARFCLEKAGVTPDQVDVVAYPWSIDIQKQKRWQYIQRIWRRSPQKALSILTKLEQRRKRHQKSLKQTLEAIGINPKIKTTFVEHHLAHAASAFHFSGFESAAFLTMDGYGELTSTLLGEGLPDGSLKKVEEILKPDSLGLFYSTFTEYLGFRANNGEYKVMGMAPYGDPSKIDLSHILKIADDGFQCSDEYVWVPRKSRLNKMVHYSERLISEFGPARVGDGLTEPYIHVAAAVQKRLEDVVCHLVQTKLKPVLERHGGRLCLAGGVALNVRLNRKLLELPEVNEIWVQPASSDAGLSLGAAAVAAAQAGDKIQAQQTSALGPSYTVEEIKAVLDKYRIPYQEVEDGAKFAAQLLAKGEIVGWFQGRMEWGPRALGQRSILGNPTIDGTADEINERVKFREKWRPYCPSVLYDHAEEIFSPFHDSPYMALSLMVKDDWKEKVPEIVHVDGSARPQFVRKEHSPEFHRLISEFKELTGIPIVMNTSLNRRGEPMVCSPDDAIKMLFGSGLEHMVLETIYVSKRSLPGN